MPPDPSRRAFTIGRVLSHAWCGFRRHFVTVTAICLTAGMLDVMLPNLLSAEIVSAALSQGALFMILLQEAARTLVATPAIVVMFCAHSGRPIRFLEIAEIAARRCVVLVIVQVVIAAMMEIPAAWVMDGHESSALEPVLTILLLGYVAVLFAFDLVLIPALIIEPKGHLHALNKTISLSSGNWVRLIILAIMVGLAGWAISWCVHLAWLSLQDATWAWAGILTPYRIYKVVNGVGTSLQLLVLLTIATAIYHLLHRAKYGEPPQEAARIFD